MLGRDGIEDEIEAAEMFRHFIRVFGIDYFIRAQPDGVLGFAGRGGKYHDVRAKGFGQFHTHMAEAAQADDADFLPLPTP